jgi:hypothetical protein
MPLVPLDANIFASMFLLKLSPYALNLTTERQPKQQQIQQRQQQVTREHVPTF